jgi:hypothetical protein
VYELRGRLESSIHSQFPQFPANKRKGKTMYNETTKYDWGRFAVFGICVVLPAIGVGYSNWAVFHDSFVLATILLIITVGVAGIVAYFSGDATPKVRKYCNVVHIIIGIFLCVNLASHFVLARAVSATKDAVADRHVEEERQDKFRKAEAERQAAILKSQTELAEAERKKANAEANKLYHARQMGYRGSGVVVGGKALQPMPSPATMPTADFTEEKKPTKTLTAKEVIDLWNAWLTFWAFADVFASVLGGLILASLWEWDRDHDGIADHLQRPQMRQSAQSQMPQLSPEEWQELRRVLAAKRANGTTEWDDPKSTRH